MMNKKMDNNAVEKIEALTQIVYKLLVKIEEAEYEKSVSNI